MQNRVASFSFLAAVIVGVLALSMLYLPAQAVADQSENGNKKESHHGNGGNGEGGLVTGDDQFVKEAKQHAGFGGMFIDEEKGITYVFLRDKKPNEAKEIVKDIEHILGQDLPDKVKVLPAKYSFVQLKRWHDRLLNQVLKEGLRKVTLLDVDDNKNRIRVGLVNSSAKDQVKKNLSKLDIPAAAVIFEVTGPIKLDKSLTDFQRPLVGGIQIDPQGGGGNFCTLGFNAISDRVEPNEEGFVTNSHCSLQRDALDNTTYYQPVQDTVNQIGVEQIDSGGFVCRLGFVVCRWSDSNFSEIEEAPGAPTVTADLGFIARPDLNSRQWNPNNTFRIVNEAPVVKGAIFPVIEGNVVTKVGRTTGRTEGEVTGVNVTPTWTYFFFNILLLDQVETNYKSRPGDSGLPVVLAQAPDQNGQVVDTTLAGIHWGTAGALVGEPKKFFSPIAGVEKDLGPLNTCAPAVGPC